MRHVIAERSARVLIVEPSISVRRVMIECLGRVGFRDVTGLPACADARSYFESGERADWVIAPIEEPADGGDGAMRLLLCLSEVPEFAEVAFSLVVRESERAMVPLAFEFGALSWMPAGFTRDSLSAEIESLVRSFERCRSNVSLVAATYLAHNLFQARDAASLKALAAPIVDMNPGAAAALLVALLARACEGDVSGARALAAQWRLLEPHADAELRALSQRYPVLAEVLREEPAASQDTLSERAGLPNVLDLQGTCVVVDPDRDACQLMHSLLHALGAPDIACFENGEAASLWLAANREPALVIQEWRIPGLSGPFLLQRVRELGHTRTPIVVASSLVRKEDSILLREMGVSSVLPKPFDRGTFLQTILWSLQQARSATELRFVDRQIGLLFDEGRKEEGMRLAASALARSDLGESARLTIEARVAYAEERLRECVEKATRALNLSPGTIGLLNLLAKALLRAGDSANALRVLERAQVLSPMNVERLCLIAQVSAEAGDEERAEASLDKARSLDPLRSEVLAHDASKALECGDSQVARAALARVPNLDGLLASLNNKAVALSRSGKRDSSIQLYRDLAACLPEGRRYLKEVVTYNLALAYVRDGNLPQALECLSNDVGSEGFETDFTPAARDRTRPSADESAWERLRAKRTSLRERVARAMQKKEAIVTLNPTDSCALDWPSQVDPGHPRSANPAYRGTPGLHSVIAEIQAGAGFLRRLFRCQGEAAKARAGFFASAPRFRSRVGMGRA